MLLILDLVEKYGVAEAIRNRLGLARLRFILHQIGIDHVAAYHSGYGNQGMSEIVVNAPISLFVGIGNGRAGDSAADIHVNSFCCVERRHVSMPHRLSR